MKRIEAGLENHHASTAAAQAAQGASGVPSSASSAPDASASSGSTSASNATAAVPFAKVNSVVPSSPAETAGLKAGDQILSFGAANWMNHDKLSKVSQEVSRNEGVSSATIASIQV